MTRDSTKTLFKHTVTFEFSLAIYDFLRALRVGISEYDSFRVSSSDCEQEFASLGVIVGPESQEVVFSDLLG